MTRRRRFALSFAPPRLDAAAEGSPQTIGRQVISGAAWAYGATASGKVLVFASTVVLARLLAPQAFGAVALVLLVLAVLDVLGGLGLGSGLVHERERVTESANACFWLMQAGAWACYLIAWIFAAPLGNFFREPAFPLMLRVLALSVPISALGGTHDALLRRDIRFRRKLVPDVASSAVKGVVSIALALIGWGAWSLVWGQLLGVIVGNVLLWVVCPWRPGLRFDAAATSRLVRFARHILVVDTSASVLGNIDKLIVGRVVGEAALGLYSLAFRVPEVVLMNLAYVLTKVLFPALSRLQFDKAQLTAAILRAVSYVSLVALPVGVGLAMVSHDFVLVAYGHRWLAAAPVLALLSIQAGISCATHHFGDGYKALGKPEYLTYLLPVHWFVMPLALYFGARLDGIIGVALGWVVYQAILTTCKVAMAMHALRVSMRDLRETFRPAMLGVVAVVLPVLMLRHMMIGDPALLRLAVCVVGAAIAYFTTLRLACPDLVEAAISTLSWRPAAQNARAA